MTIRKYIQITLLTGLLAIPAVTLASPAPSNSSAAPSAVPSAAPSAAPAMDMMTLLTKLNDSGYNYIKEVELGSNGTYKVETLDAAGKKLELTIDPAHPNLPVQTASIKVLNTAEIAKKVMDAGYVNITKIKFKGDCYDVKAHDKNGKNVRLDVSVTGEISKDWF